MTERRNIIPTPDSSGLIEAADLATIPAIAGMPPQIALEKAQFKLASLRRDYICWTADCRKIHSRRAEELESSIAYLTAICAALQAVIEAEVAHDESTHDEAAPSFLETVSELAHAGEVPDDLPDEPQAEPQSEPHMTDADVSAARQELYAVNPNSHNNALRFFWAQAHAAGMPRKEKPEDSARRMKACSQWIGHTAESTKDMSADELYRVADALHSGIICGNWFVDALSPALRKVAA